MKEKRTTTTTRQLVCRQNIIQNNTKTKSFWNASLFVGQWKPLLLHGGGFLSYLLEPARDPSPMLSIATHILSTALMKRVSKMTSWRTIKVRTANAVVECPLLVLIT
jgi:hypothetical protein